MIQHGSEVHCASIIFISLTTQDLYVFNELIKHDEHIIIIDLESRGSRTIGYEAFGINSGS